MADLARLAAEGDDAGNPPMTLKLWINFLENVSGIRPTYVALNRSRGDCCIRTDPSLCCILLVVSFGMLCLMGDLLAPFLFGGSCIVLSR